jgi:hypothetical protein
MSMGLDVFYALSHRADHKHRSNRDDAVYVLNWLPKSFCGALKQPITWDVWSDQRSKLL